MSVHEMRHPGSVASRSDKTYTQFESKRCIVINPRRSEHSLPAYAVGLAMGLFSSENMPYMVKNLAETVSTV